MNNITLVGKIQRMNVCPKVAYITLLVKTKKDEAEFIPITVFQHEFLTKYFQEGKWIGITGHLHINKRKDSYITEVIADDLFFVGDKIDNNDKDDFNEFTAEDYENALPWK